VSRSRHSDFGRRLDNSRSSAALTFAEVRKGACRTDQQARICLRRLTCREGRGFQVVGRSTDRRGDVFQHLRYAWHLSVGLGPFLGVHVFADGGNGFSAVSGVSARRVDLMLEPGALRESSFGQEGALDFQKIHVERLHGFRGQCGCARSKGFCEGSLVALCAVLDGFHSIL